MALFSKKQSDIPRRRRVELGKKSADDTSGVSDDRYAFRRNRTITGSASSHVSALSESTAQLKSSRVQAHELMKKRRHIGGALLATIAGCLLLLGLIWQFTAGIDVRAQDVKTDDLTPVYEQVIQSYFLAQPIERLRFLINNDHLNEYVQSKAPEIEHIEASGSGGFGKTTFDVIMRKPIASWSINSHQQYVDSTGTAFDRNYYGTPDVQVVDKSGIQVQAGQAVASNRFLGFVGRAVGLARKYGYKVTQVIIPSGATREIQLQLDGVGYPIKLSVDRPAGEQVEDMQRAIVWVRLQNKTPKYLDVRVSGKAFYQ
jgi:hypothetical protein